LTRIKITQIAIFRPRGGEGGQYSICKQGGIQQYLYLVVIFHTDNLAHKLVHTFEKMDAINPTFELIEWERERYGII
jgi:hypothetical protein